MPKIVLFLIVFGVWTWGMAQTPPEEASEEASLDLYLDQHVGSNEFYDRYDQPNLDVWHEYVSYEEELSGIDQNVPQLIEKGGKFRSTYGNDLNKNVAHAPNFWPLAIEDESLSGLISAFQGRLAEAYQEDVTLDVLINEIQTSFGEADTIGEETCEPFDPGKADAYGKGCFCSVPVLLKDQRLTQDETLSPLEERWKNFKEFYDYLDVSEIESNDLEKLILMNEQEKISMIASRGGREDDLLERVYQTQESVIQFLAKIMVIKEQIKYLNKAMPQPQKGSVQQMLSQKVQWDDYLDGLWALRRQLEALTTQFEAARRGRNLSIREPVLYRYDKSSTPDIKKINAKEAP